MCGNFLRRKYPTKRVKGVKDGLSVDVDTAEEVIEEEEEVIVTLGLGLQPMSRHQPSISSRREDASSQIAPLFPSTTIPTQLRPQVQKYMRAPSATVQSRGHFDVRPTFPLSFSDGRRAFHVLILCRGTDMAVQ